jgi:hypothetical protein
VVITNGWRISAIKIELHPQQSLLAANFERKISDGRPLPPPPPIFNEMSELIFIRFRRHFRR